MLIVYDSGNYASPPFQVVVGQNDGGGEDPEAPGQPGQPERME